MTQLPIPKRTVIVVEKGYSWVPSTLWSLLIYTDAEVAEFIDTLAPVRYVERLIPPANIVHFDTRFTYDGAAFDATVKWLEEQIELEFGGTPMPAKPQPE